MAQIRAALGGVVNAQKLNHRLLARAQRRYKANRKRAYIAHNKQLKAQTQADAARAEGGFNASGGWMFDKQARRHAHIAHRNHLRAEHYLQVVKKLQQRIHGLKTKAEHFEAELKKNKAKVSGNKVTGGTACQRLRAAIHAAARNCASGDQHNYYDQGGAAPDLRHTLEHMPYGHRFDCSSFVTGIYFACGLKDPNGGHYETGETMYTGSLGECGKRVSESQAKTGDLVFYGPFPHHHVEVVDDPKARTTIGHGSPPIDAGIFDLFDDGDYEIRSYL